MSTVRRYDFGALGSAKPLPGGGARIPARLTRVGIFVYRDASGGTRRELRPKEEVFAPESLATLPLVAVTNLHPADGVTWRQHSIGVVAENVRKDSDKFVSADLAIHDGEALTMIASGQRREVSAGYNAVVEFRSGTWNGQPYDAIQRNIRYDHVAIGPAGWGRAGSEVALRVDGAEIMVPDEAPELEQIVRFWNQLRVA